MNHFIHMGIFSLFILNMSSGLALGTKEKGSFKPLKSRKH